MARQIDFTILYEGEAVSSHSMDVKELAPSLIACADFLEESFRELYGKEKSLKVQFKANKEGSLGVELTVIADLVETFTTFFNSDEASALANLLSIVGLITAGISTSVASLIKTIKWLKNRKIKRVISRDQGPNVIIETEDGSTLEVRREVPKLLRSLTIRENLSMFLAPLRKKGFDSIKFLSNKNEVQESINSDEVEYFDTPEVDDETIVEETRKAAFTISSLSFKEGNKWRLSDGSRENYPVTISDKAFLDKVQNNQVSFAINDVLVVKLQTKQFKTLKGLRTEHEILEVIDHQSSTPQLHIPFDNE